MVGEVRGLEVEGMTDFRIFACCFGSCLVSSRLVFSFSRLAVRMSLLSLFLYCECFFMLSVVGFRFLIRCSLCWCRICRLYVGVIQAFCRVGVRSKCSMEVRKVVWMLWRRVDVVVFGCMLMFAISVLICVRIVCLWLLYLFIESVFWLLCCFRGVGVWRIVRVGRWSVIGGEMVPASAGVL